MGRTGLCIAGYFFPAPHSLPFIAPPRASASSMSVRNLLAEFHPWNRRARTVIEKMRVTGLVVLATSIAGLVVAAVLAALVAYGLLRCHPYISSLRRPRSRSR